jgi:hypothetical protein
MQVQITLNIPDSTVRKFMESIDKTDSCWNWRGATSTKPDGRPSYGRVSLGTSVHRFAYLLAKGAIPLDFEIDHLCKNTLCVNPDHLEAVTKPENMRRSNSPMARQGRQTHCIHGHTFDDVNTYRSPDGKRRCRACRRARQLQHSVHAITLLTQPNN